MTDKPSYLGLLNAISNGESAAECYFNAWAAVTPNPAVRQVVSTVGLREGEHGKAFAKRINELGFSVEPRSDGKEAERMAIAGSTTLSDRVKFEKLRLGQPVNPEKPDGFPAFFNDATIDIATGTLLGRYISEERDSGKMLRGCYEALCAEDLCAEEQCAQDQSTQDQTTNGVPAMSQLDERLCRIETLLETVALSGAKTKKNKKSKKKTKSLETVSA